jgi:UDP-glucose:glycoprotein glucosyltransferase
MSRPWSAAVPSLLVALATCLLISACGVDAKGVSVRLGTPGWQTSLLAEAGEVLRAVNETAFWSMVSTFDVEDLPIKTERRQIEAFLTALEAVHLPLHQLVLVKAGIAGRAFSPLIEAQQQLRRRPLLVASGETDAEAKAGNEASFCDGPNEALLEMFQRRFCLRSVADLNKAFDTIRSFKAEQLERSEAPVDGHQQSDAVFRPVSDATPFTVALYSLIGHKITREIHDALRVMPNVAYAFRTKVPLSTSGSPYLPGFGVVLDLKNMEYKAVDEKANPDAGKVKGEILGFHIDVLSARYPDLSTLLQEFSEEIDEDSELKVWQLQNLGYQAVHAVVHSKDPWQELAAITERFPFRVAPLSRIPQSELKDTIDALNPLHMRFGEAAAQFVLNGREVPKQKQDFFSLLTEVMLDEKEFEEISEVVGSSDLATVQKFSNCPFKPTTARTRYWVQEEYVTWLNNVEKDSVYSDLGRSVREILKPSYYGQPQFPRRNLFNLIYIIDPTTTAAGYIAGTLNRFLYQGIAIRMGIIAVTTKTDDVSIAAIEAFYAVQAEQGFKALKYIEALSQVGTLTMNDVIDAAAAQKVKFAPGNKPELIERRKLAHDYVFRTLGIRQSPVAFFNGLFFEDNVDSALYQGYNLEFQPVRRWISNEVLTDDTKDLYSAIMELTNAVKRHQPLVVDSSTIRYTPWTGAVQRAVLRQVPWLPTKDYDEDPIHFSHILVLRETNASSIFLATQLAEHLSGCADKCLKTKATIAVCGAAGPIQRIIDAALYESQEFLVRKRSPHLLTLLRSIEETQQSVDQSVTTELEIAKKAIFTAGESFSYLNKFLESSTLPRSRLCAAVAANSHLPAKGDFLYTNGRVIAVDETFIAADYLLLETYESERAASLSKCLQEVDFAQLNIGISADDLSNDFFAQKHFTLASILGYSMNVRGVKDGLESFPAANHLYSITHSPELGRHDLRAMINPVGRESQKIVGLINSLRKLLHVKATVVLNPPVQVSQVPIKNFYQFLEPALTFAEDGRLQVPQAVFQSLPSKKILTLGVDAPEAWLVFASEAEADLDNIRLSDHSSNTVRAEYVLESITVTGACEDKVTTSPPRGLPLAMVRATGADRVGVRDTLVMSNYGYFQLQGAPGFWTLKLQDKGDALYQVDTMTSAYTGDHLKLIPVTSLLGQHIYLWVRKRPGKEGESLLFEGHGGENNQYQMDHPEAGATKAIWPPNPADPTPSSPPKRPTLNIFSVASGHLYERFLRMMMYTVTQSSKDKHGANTTHIKFWFIENFLSPRFKAFLPKLSQKLGCSYQLVSYKWPHWLRAQTEKQRIIWAYKILFLDVLFPLDVEKIIFIDSDQIVRADLHELYNMDLKGNAVAYTPFCHGAKRRDETKGFRFWDSGYWVDHLRGKFYHISAIYVVDLKRLRQYAAGDQYRMIYDNLSADPNSLANLDQDLPNFAQHQVGIYSLPQEWLWCETWCTDESKVDAKTIDLCNNPLTKTPKLENAKRIIPEWEELDAKLQKWEEEL